MLSQFKTVLILAPHTDDGEFGCGGTVAKLIDMKKKVYYAAFSSCEKSLINGRRSDTLVKELKKATQILKIPPSRVIVKNFEVRCFERDRQEILEEMVLLKRDLSPDLVFLPSPKDLHQDHATVACEGLRAFKLSTTILGYEMPWNNLTFDTTCFICLTEKNLQRKIAALKCYGSQSNRFYAKGEYVKSLAITRGAQVGARYAETFEVLRWIIP